MITLEKIIYTAKTHTTSGGRDGGQSRSDDGRLDVTLSRPGGSAPGTNPEQLLAAGWSGCFLSAVKIVAGKRRITLPAELAIDTEIDLGIGNGAHGLAARLTVSMPGIDRETALSLVNEASNVCPYSLAIKGNIAVAYDVITAQVPESVHA